MGIRDYLKNPEGRRSISQAIRGAFERKRGTAGRVLVVDLDPMSREALVRILRRANYHAVGVADDAEAVGLCQRSAFDLMIRETRRTDADEAEAQAALQQRTPDLKVLTVLSGGGQARTCVTPNTLVRPFDTRQLLQAIKRALQDVQPE
jgi:DNA-binding NtrC family response regulator